MKTAQTWVDEYKKEKFDFATGAIDSRKLIWHNGDLVRTIQLDAYKAGLMKARSRVYVSMCGRMDNKDKIDETIADLTNFHNNLTELPKE